MRVTFAVVTNRLDFDERVRKEAVMLTELGHEVDIVALESRNLAEKGETADGISYRTVRLATRSWFPQNRFLVVKARVDSGQIGDVTACVIRAFMNQMGPMNEIR